MANEPILIPAKVVHNWDFKKYPVSQRAFNYIDEIKDHPTIDLKVKIFRILLNVLLYIIHINFLFVGIKSVHLHGNR